LCADAFPSSPPPPSAISDLGPGATLLCSNQARAPRNSPAPARCRRLRNAGSRGNPSRGGVGLRLLLLGSGALLCSALLCFGFALLATVVFENRKVREGRFGAF
jgi:hypothetical protein